jgi:hypothetical protein
MICLPLVPSRRIRGPKIRPTRRRSGTGRPVALEPLESRALLAVTATLVGGDLVIAYNQAGDLIADITSDGTKYTVTGSGLVSQQFNVADVTGVITVRDDAAIFGQQFSVNDGIALANALQVNASVESTSLIGGITTATAGDVLIGSSAISLGNDISTAATNATIVLSGATTLSGSVSLSTGSGGGNITFGGTLDGAYGISLTAGDGTISFAGKVGNGTPLAGIGIKNTASTTFSEAIKLDGSPRIASHGLYLLFANNVTLNAVGSRIANFLDDGIIFYTASSGSTIANVEITGNGDNGIEFLEGDYTGTKIQSNAITFNDGLGICLDATGGALTNLTIGGDKTAVTSLGNAIYSNGSGGIQADAGSYTGTVIQGNSIISNKNRGIFLDASGGTLGGLTIGAGVGGNGAKFGNLIESSTSDGFLTSTGIVVRNGTYTGSVIAGGNEIGLNEVGIYLDYSGVTSLTIAENFIGTLADGTTDKGNLRSGIEAAGGDYTGTVIRSNAIAFNDSDGLNLRTGEGALTNLTIGGDKTATQSLGNAIYENGIDGIQADKGDYTGTVIQGNSITDNARFGVYLFTVRGGTLSNLTIGAGVGGNGTKYGNLIESNTSIGIYVDTGTYTGTVIAGGNEIGLNLDGIWLSDNGVKSLTIAENFIGTLADGTTDKGNLRDGISVDGGDFTGTVIQRNQIHQNDTNGIFLDARGDAITGLTIGGSQEDGNSIQASGASGVYVTAGDYGSTVIEGNTIEANGRHGIYLLGGEGSTSIGRLVITTPGLSGSPLTSSSAAQLQKPLNPQSSSIQAIANAGYPTVMPSLQSLGATVAGTPPTTLVPSGEIEPGIAGIANPGAAYQAAAQTAFETNPALPTNGFDGLAVYDAATSGAVPASPPGAEPQDSYLFYDFIVAAGGVGGLSITGNTLADNVATGLRADEGDHSGTTVQGNTIEGNRFGIVLVGARNFAIGGADAGQGNTIVGGGNAGGGQYRDGIYATGVLNGTTVVGTTITNAACGLVLDSAQSLTIDQVAVSNTQSHALWAKGALAGTVLDGLVVSRTTAVTTGVSAVLMNAEGLTVQNADVSGDGWGAYVFGTSTGTAITGSKLVGMSVGLNAYTATGLTLEATTANGGSYGLVTTGSLTGTRFLTSTFTAAGGGVAAGLYRTTGATFQGNSFGATGTTFGVYATGTSTGTTFISNTLARNVVGLHLAAATELEFGRVGTGNTISGSTFAGLEAGGACTGSVVLATSWSTNVGNVINKATGLTVNPA